MAHAIEEVEDMVSIAGALVINIGTLSEKWIKAMHICMLRAKKLKKPFYLICENTKTQTPDNFYEVGGLF